MAISTEQTRVNTYTPDGVQTTFQYTFVIFEDTDLTVTIDGVEKTLGTDYTVTGVGDAGGGNVVFTTAPTGTKLVIESDVSYKQGVDFTDALYAGVLEAALDRITVLSQQARDLGERAIRFKAGTAMTDFEIDDDEIGTDKVLGFSTIGIEVKNIADIGIDVTRKIDQDFSQNYAVATGSSNAFSVTLSPAPLALTAGMLVIWKANHTITGSATLNVNSLGAETIKKSGGQDTLDANDIKNGDIVVTIFNGTDWVVIGVVSKELATIKDNLALNFFLDGGTKQSLEDGFIDRFEDETGIDTTASSNQSYDATGDYYEPALPDDECTGGTASASSTYSTYYPSQAFDDDDDTIWYSGGVVPQWIQYDFGSGNAKTVKQYALTCPTSSNDAAMFKSWQFQGSNDASSWTTLDTQTDVTFLPLEKKSFDLSNTTAYRYYRFYVTDVPTAGGWPRVAEIEMMEANGRLDMTLVSNAEEAEAEPNDSRLILFCEPIDSITLNTDLKGYVSLDDGTTWEQVTLADEGDYESGKHIYSGNATFSASGEQTMRCKVETDNNKDLKLHGWQMQWE